LIVTIDFFKTLDLVKYGIDALFLGVYFMTQLIPLRLDDGTILYIEATEDVQESTVKVNENDEEVVVTRGNSSVSQPQQILQNFQAIEGTIRSYTTYTLNAFRHLAIANIDKVTLEFGIKVGGEAGIPYVTKGTAESNLKITVECSFPKG
jgi:Trypsin-co-occurring domain 1